MCIVPAACNLFYFFLRQLTSTHPVEYTVIASLRHQIYSFSFGAFSKRPGVLKNQIAALLIQHGVRMVECAGGKGSSDRNGPGSRNLIYFTRRQLTSAYSANYTVVVLG